ncbi:MAG: type 4 pilus major pilin [Alphaproteobacteria bacterium]
MICRKTQKRNFGFTLTEIAIVLGIIGLILGAIWLAASSVYNNLRVSRAEAELLQISQAVRSMYATAPTVDAGANMITLPFTSVITGAQTTYAQSNIFPSDMVTITNPGGAIAYTITNPWGGSVNIIATLASTPNDSFAISFDGVPRHTCIGLLTVMTGSSRDPYMHAVQTGTSGTLTIAPGATGSILHTTFPLTPTTANTACVTNANVNIAFQFRLKG